MSTEQEDVDLEHAFTCDPTRLDPDVDAPAMSPVEHAILLGRHYLREDERTRRSLGVPPIKHPARLPGPPPTEPSYRAEAEHAAQLGGRIVSRLLTGVHAAAASPAPGPKTHGHNPLARWWRRLFRKGS